MVLYWYIRMRDCIRSLAHIGEYALVASPNSYQYGNILQLHQAFTKWTLCDK